MSQETEDSTDFSAITAELAKANEPGKKYTKFTKVEWGKVPYGDTKLMILKGRPLFVEVLVHHGYTDSKGIKRAYLCAKPKYGKCPGCDEAKRLKEAGQVKEAIAKGARLSYLYNGVDAEGKNKTFGLKKSQLTVVLLEINNLRNDEEDPVDATEPENNVFLKITRMKTSPYALARSVRGKNKMSKEEAKRLLDGKRDLANLYQDLSPDDWNKILAGKDVIITSDAAPEDDGDDTPAETAAPAKASAKPAPAAAKAEAKPAPAANKDAPKVAAKPAPTVEKTDDGELVDTSTGEILDVAEDDEDLKAIEKLLEG